MADQETQTVVLPAIVDLDSLDTFRDKLIDAIDRGDASVDGSAVERVATNALMMLLSAAETARRNKNGFSVVATSEPMQSAIQRLGLMPHFAPLVKG
ncbi:MAG: STAS domain-containing protein [Alphaproteobacteria bacterium]|nr:STAS domain-containing protein [Alphaproteobacteria bacterium]